LIFFNEIFWPNTHAKVDVGTPVAIYWVKKGVNMEETGIGINQSGGRNCCKPKRLLEAEK